MLVSRALRAALDKQCGGAEEFLRFLAGKDICIQDLSLAQIEAELQAYMQHNELAQDFQPVDDIDEEYRYELSSDKPMPLSEFFCTDVTVRVVEERNTTKLLLFSSREYLIETAPLGWRVARSLQHFAELAVLLADFLPLTFVPPFRLSAFRRLDRQFQSPEARRQYIQLFLAALLENPYIKSHALLQSFLSADGFEAELARFRAQRRPRRELERLLADSANQEAAIPAFLRSLPSFKQRAVIRTNHCIIQLAACLHGALAKLAEVDSRVLGLAREVHTRAGDLTGALQDFSAALAQRIRLKEQLAADFDLAYGPYLSAADAHVRRFAELLKGSAKKTQELFSSGYTSALSYEKLKDDQLAQFQRRIIEWRGAARSGAQAAPDAEAVDVLKAYITAMSNFSFKHAFIFKNKRECEQLAAQIEEAELWAAGLRDGLRTLHGDVGLSLRAFPSNKDFMENFASMAADS